MKKEFVDWCLENLDSEKDVFLTADVGYNALEEVQKKLQQNFINVGVAEQNMINVAAGLSVTGLRPYCYGIASFTVYRAVEQIRLNVAVPAHNVKIVGNGSGYAYGKMGPTHHCLGDLSIFLNLPNFTIHIPCHASQVAGACELMNFSATPSYLRLGFLEEDSLHFRPPFYQPVLDRGVNNAKLTIVALGTPSFWLAEIVGDQAVDLFIVQRLPLLPVETEKLISSLQVTKKLLVVEDHLAKGGLGDLIAMLVLQAGLPIEFFRHISFGNDLPIESANQMQHWERCGLTPKQLSWEIAGMV